jgi:glutaredoxin
VIRVEVYGKAECALCDDVKAVLRRVQREIPFELGEVDIAATPELWATYNERVPLVFVNGRLAFKFRVDEAALRRRLARERLAASLKRRLQGFFAQFFRSSAN